MIRNDWDLIEYLTGYQPAAVITTAHQLGLFEALGADPKTGNEMARDLGLDPSNLVALLNALERLGLVNQEAGRYAATPYTRRRLGPGGVMGLVVAKEAVFAQAWNRLDEVMVSGGPVMEDWRSRLGSHPAQARAFLEAIDVLARIGGPDLSGVSVLAPGRRVLDVGGGLGTYSRRMAEVGALVTLVDYPQVVSWAEAELEGWDIELVGVDLFEHPSCGVQPGSMDVALVSHLLHDLNEDLALDLMRRVHAALRPGGHVVVNEFAGDSGPDAFGPLFDLMMRVETAGAAHSRNTLESILARAGFADLGRLPYEDPLTVYLARVAEGG